jgi:Asp-tRNA(Asn)/Glu-tRNA(Gln) amidotransferase A subunit family amidase
MNEIGFLRQIAVDRRAFLGGLAASAALPLVSSKNPLGTKEDIAAAQRLTGLEFSDQEIEQIAPSVERIRAGFEELRRHEVTFWTPPAWNFDPLPPGVKPPSTESEFEVRPSTGQISTSDSDLAYASIPQLAGLLKSGKLSSRRLTTLAIQRLEQHDPQLHCVVTLLKASALAAADQADREIAAGQWRGILHGIPYGAKDLFAWPGAPTTFGAAPYKNQIVDMKATVLRKLEAQGAILVAKLTLGALAMGDYWFGGQTRNPWNPKQGSSGSSAGPAAAVAAGLLPFAIGTETLGSIVSPCRRCGVAGLRPTFGTVSRHGAMPLSWSMDKIGPIARHAIDLAIVYDAIRGADGKDSMIRNHGFAWPPSKSLQGLRVGLVASRGSKLEQSDMVKWLRERGAKVSKLELPDFPYRALRNILTAEAATAFDDLTRSDDIDTLTRQTANSWPSTFRAARFVPAVEYLRATRMRTQLIEAMHTTMQDIDIYLATASGNSSLYCTNLTGHPTVILPSSQSSRSKQPESLTLVGQLYGESTLLGVANEWQKDTKWHLGRPI